MLTGRSILLKQLALKSLAPWDGRRKLHNEELHSLYPSLNIRMIKSRLMRWAGNVARMEEMRNVHKILVGKLKGK
jgi:hypothetical protein